MTQNPPIDWPAIRLRYEQGASQSTLAREYGVTQPAISQRARKEGWQQKPVMASLIAAVSSVIPISASASDEITATSIIPELLKHIARLAKDDHFPGLEAKDVKSLTDALSQIVKIELLTRSDDKPSASGIAAELLPYFSTEQLNEWTELEKAQTAIIEMVQAQKLEQEQNIKTIRRAM